MEPDAREAKWMAGLDPHREGEYGRYFRVGYAGVTRITVTQDLPGLHCNMERVRVFAGEAMIFEAPLHNLEGVGYCAPEAAND